MRFLPYHAVSVKWSACSNEPATLLNERRNEKIKILNYVVGMKRYISFLKSASHSATLYFQPTLTEKKSLVY